MAIAQRNYYSHTWQQLWMVFMVLLPAISCLSLNSTLLEGSLACPGQRIRFECTVDSPILAWSSPQYIRQASTRNRIEFTTIDDIGTVTPSSMGTSAMLIDKNDVNVTESWLYITASQDFPMASVACEDHLNNPETISFQVLSDVPGMPQNVGVFQRSAPSTEGCEILLSWNSPPPPDGVTTSLISNYSIYISDSGRVSTFSQASTVVSLRLQNCLFLEDTTVRISAVDICGREGANTENALTELLQEPNVIVVTPNMTATTPTPGGLSVGVMVASLGGAFGVTTVSWLIIGVISSLYYKARERARRQTSMKIKELQARLNDHRLIIGVLQPLLNRRKQKTGEMQKKLDKNEDQMEDMQDLEKLNEKEKQNLIEMLQIKLDEYEEKVGKLKEELKIAETPVKSTRGLGSEQLQPIPVEHFTTTF